jgi:cbb3-type cytochrome oxidase subunit 3
MMETIYDWAVTLWPLWLIILFLAIVARVYWPSRKAEMEKRGRIPFDDDREG